MRNKTPPHVSNVFHKRKSAVVSACALVALCLTSSGCAVAIHASDANEEASEGGQFLSTMQRRCTSREQSPPLPYAQSYSCHVPGASDGEVFTRCHRTHCFLEPVTFRVYAEQPGQWQFGDTLYLEAFLAGTFGTAPVSVTRIDLTADSPAAVDVVLWIDRESAFEVRAHAGNRWFQNATAVIDGFALLEGRLNGVLKDGFQPAIISSSDHTEEPHRIFMEYDFY